MTSLCEWPVYQELMPMPNEMRQGLLSLRQEWKSWEESESFDRNKVLALDLDIVDVFGCCNLEKQTKWWRHWTLFSVLWVFTIYINQELSKMDCVATFLFKLSVLIAGLPNVVGITFMKSKNNFFVQSYLYKTSASKIVNTCLHIQVPFLIFTI